MSRVFEHCAYSLNVTQEGTDVNGFWTGIGHYNEQSLKKTAL